MHKRNGPVGVVHLDAAADVNYTIGGEKFAHGTPFRRAVEEGLLDCFHIDRLDPCFAPSTGTL